MRLRIDWRCWSVGLYWDHGLVGLDLGPVGISWLARHKLPIRSWMLFERTIGKANLHLDVDSYCWRLGYMRAAAWDHGFYLGPISLQIEWNIDPIDLRPINARGHYDQQH